MRSLTNRAAAAHSAKQAAGVEGSNEATRKANLLLALTDEQGTLDRAEAAKTGADLQVALAKLDWDAAREQVKIHTLMPE